MTAPSRNRGWIWFYLALAVLTVTLLTYFVVFSWKQQLTQEQLESACALWKEKGPADYDLEYTEKGSIAAKYVVHVRKGRVVYAEPDDRALEEKRGYYGMNALFGFIATFLKEDAEPGRPRTYTRATFDPEDGHLEWYVRRVMGTRERLEITVRLTRVAEAGPQEESPPDKAATATGVP